MTIKLYFDEDSMDWDLIKALRARGLDIKSSLEEKMINKTDEEHLEFAANNNWVLFSFNRSDFYKLHTLYTSQGKFLAGIILANQQQYSVGELLRRILQLAATKTTEGMKNWVEFLSVWQFVNHK
jgi:predicted nuclease of predicted toxin-antitoxin system